jgi:hypothetical protein
MRRGLSRYTAAGRPPHRPDSCRPKVRRGAGQGASLLDRGATPEAPLRRAGPDRTSHDC